MNTKNIPLNDLHVALGGKMVPFAGYNMPVRYNSDKEEHMKIRESVGVFDVSHMGEFEVTGPNALALIQKVTSNDASKLIDGQAQYSCLPNDIGGIVDDLIVYKKKDNDYLLVVNASNIDKDWNWISSQNTMAAEMKNISDNICLFAVQGPKATEVLQTITTVDLSSIKFYHFTEGNIGGVDDVIISATGYTGSGGFELYVRNDQAEALWNAVFEAGKPHDIQPIGLGARDTLRLEMGYCLYGNDIDDHTSPIEAGLGWITKFTKDFVNHEQIAQHKAEGVDRKLVGFKMVGRGIPRHGYPIKSEDGTELGQVTSGTMSPSLNLGVGLGYVTTGNHLAETTIYIEIRGKLIEAVITRPPFVKI
ncbi:MAG: aminomethyltransferase [Cyclobacteriaceae bacterium]|jgi:aminomethyltransferase